MVGQRNSYRNRAPFQPDYSKKRRSSVPGSEELVVTIYGSRDEINTLEEGDNFVSPAQDALFRVHDKVVAEDLHPDEESEGHQITARLIVSSDQIGCFIGKGGQIVQNIRSETGAQIHILKESCLLICGEAAVVKKALHQIASHLHENPSRTQHLLASAMSSAYPAVAAAAMLGPAAAAQIVSIASLAGRYGGYKGDTGEWPRSLYSAPRDEMSSKEFSLHFVCLTANIGGVIGKGGAIINQIRQESGTVIRVDSSSTEGDDCLITISAKEFFENTYSLTIEAAARLQPRCSEKVEGDSGILSFTTCLLVQTSRIGCLIGKGGAIIAGELDVSKDALVQIASRLRANFFDREGAVSALVPVLPYVPVQTEGTDSLSYESRESKGHGCGHFNSGGYGFSDLAASDSYGDYGGHQVGGSSAYGGYSSGRGGLFG
ncbi:hypothetical protein PTKIN_Ptkin07bG0053700 [Pterospermum kingtungense]